MKCVESMIEELEVDPKRYWFIRCKVYAKNKQWNALEELSKEEDEPLIGFVPFAEYCIESGELEEAQKYIERVKDTEAKVLLYLATKNYGESINIAFSEKSKYLLNIIYSTTTNLTIRKEIENRIDLLS
mmetsp:Transcript_7242/g.10657  ORF Transcript_7242/g.10657 Transcript_7242/m.10657 type:complete len:129 (-) Transcript_7242:153-539(-)